MNSLTRSKHMSRGKNSRREKLSRRPFKLRWFSKRKHCMCRRHNRHAAVEVVDDVAEENRANSRANRAQTRRDEGAEMVTTEEDPM
jgi:hypothetical protein